MQDAVLKSYRLKKIKSPWPLLTCLLILMCGCAVGPDYHKPEVDMPDAWDNAVMQGQMDLRHWWTTLDDPVLDSLVERAVQSNLNLQIAVSRIQETRASLGVASGQYWPTVDAQGYYSRARSSENGTYRALGIGGTYSDLYNAGLDASWEIDVFGRIKRTVESALASYEGSLEDHHDVQVSICAEVARQYVLIRTLQQRLAYAQSNLELQQQTLQLTKDRRAAEISPELDVAQAELNLANTESTLPTLQIQLTQALNRLAVLLGEHPGSLQEELNEFQAIPTGPDQLLADLPINLLRQRPDIRRAERQVAAQNAQIGVSTAALYPSFSLSGTFAFESTSSGDLMDWGSRTLSLLPAVRWNLFDGNRIRSNIQVQEARTQQAILSYEQTVLSALEETEAAMVSYLQEQERAQALERSVTASRKSVELVNSLYRNGLVDFQNVLDMQRSLAQQEDSLAASQGSVIQNLVLVYKALGGGWTPALERANQSKGDL